MTFNAPPLRAGDVVRIRGERWRTLRHIPYGTAALIEVQGCESSNRGEHARFLLPAEPFDRLPLSNMPRVVRPGRWRNVARRALIDAFPPWTSLRAATRARLTLFPFQLEPAQALLRGEGCRFVIADAVGMGKTVQAALMIAEVLQRRGESRALVVSPAGLRDQWRDELKQRFGLAAEVLDAESVARAGAGLPAGMNPWSIHPLAITSIDYVKRPEVMRCLETLIWDVIVFDEAHALAGPSDRAAAAAALGSRARISVLLTATPHAGDAEAFRRMCAIGDVKDGHALVWFRRSRTDAAVAGSRRTVLLRVRPTPAEMAMHRALQEYGRSVWKQPAGVTTPAARLAMSVLLRRACSSATSLARSVQRRLALLPAADPIERVQPTLPFSIGGSDDDEPDAVLAAADLPDAREERVTLERIEGLALAAAAAESKLAALRRLLTRIDEPAIVFTEYRDTLERLADSFADIETVQLHGGLRSSERMEALRRFTAGPARLLLATDAASEGLNLHQRCRLVINLELPWTPLRLEQRDGRVDRIGQPRTVHALHLVAAHTGEEDVLARLAGRLNRMHAALSAPALLPDETLIADCVLTGRTLPAPETVDSPAARQGIRTPDLTHEARAEAARIDAERRLIALDPAGRSARVFYDDHRPAMTLVRRRAPTAAGSRCYWLFRLRFAGPDGRVVWESMAPLGADAIGTRTPTATHTRALLDPDHPLVRHALARAGAAQQQQLEQALNGPLRLWARREAALMTASRDRHARLSAGLVQLGLFDRRSEQTAAAQSVLLDAVLAHSSARMTELAGCGRLHLDSSELVFAVAVE